MQITVWAGYTGRTKNVGSGFATKKSISACIKEGSIFVREFEGPDCDGNNAIIEIPSKGIGGCTPSSSPSSIKFKRLRQAEHAIRCEQKQILEVAKKNGWHTQPTLAAKEALNELYKRVNPTPMITIYKNDNIHIDITEAVEIVSRKIGRLSAEIAKTYDLTSEESSQIGHEIKRIVTDNFNHGP